MIHRLSFLVRAIDPFLQQAAALAFLRQFLPMLTALKNAKDLTYGTHF
jgi:hypothetical protein